MSKDKLKKIKEWQEASANLSYYKELEMRLRLEITDPLLKGKKEGTHTFHFDNAEVKAVKKYNYSIDEEVYEEVKDEFTDAENGCIKIKHDLGLKAYKALDKEARARLDNCITVKPGAPSLSVKIVE